jgi:hypothetical protein
MPKLPDKGGIFDARVLLERLGPAPTITQVAHFLQESPSTTWRRVVDGQFKTLGGEGTTRINLNSLVTFLNQGCDYQINHKRGQKPRAQKTKTAAQ